MNKAMADNTARRRSARKAWSTRKSARYKSVRTDRAGKEALKKWCRANGWKVLFFEGTTGAPRTGIIDAVMARIRPRDADGVEFRLVQLKSGTGGLKAPEVTRLKRSTRKIHAGWLVAEFDGRELHFLGHVSERDIMDADLAREGGAR